jgi:hypothetical protein
MTQGWGFLQRGMLPPDHVFRLNHHAVGFPAVLSDCVARVLQASNQHGRALSELNSANRHASFPMASHFFRGCLALRVEHPLLLVIPLLQQR